MVEDWETSRLDRKCPNQVGNFSRQVGFLSSAVNLCLRPVGSGVLVLNYDRPGSASSQVGYSIGQDGKCV